MSNLPPPHNLEAEAAVLSAVLLDASGARLDEVRSVLGAQAFYARPNGLVFQAACDLVDQGEKIDIVTLLQRLRDQKRDQQVGGAAYLMQLADATPAVANVVEHANIVREHYRVRQAIALGQRRIAEGYTDLAKDPRSVQAWLEAYESDVADLAHVYEQRKLVSLSQVLDETKGTLVAIRQGGAAGVPTGFAAVDAQTTGLHNGDFYIVAGRPGSGKTAYGLGVAERVAGAGHGVAMFSVEMPRVQLGMRLLAMDARVNLKALREGKVSNAEQLKLDMSLQVLHSLPLFIDDSAVVTPLEIKARVKRLQREIAGGKHPSVTTGRVGAVLVDYLQLVRPARETHSREQDVASIGRELKQLAKSLGVPVIALCQLNREVEKRVDKRPMLSDLRECLAGETLVYDPQNGALLRIDSLRRGTWVLTLNTKTLKLEPAHCERVVKTGRRKTVRVTTRTGRTIRLTPSHPVFTLDGWKPIGKLEAGEAFAVTRASKNRPTKVRDRLPLQVAYAVEATRRLLGVSQQTLGYRFQHKRIGRQDLTRVARELQKESLRQGISADTCGAFLRLAQSDVLWDTVRSIEPGGWTDVYDLVVPKNHCFVANDIVVHNSGALEQEADAVLFLYRPAYYDRTNDPALKGWAEIIVAKQRNGPTGIVRVAFKEDCTRFDNLQPGDAGVYDAVQTSWLEPTDDFDDQFEQG